jgi:hypothetical protein
LSVVVAAPLSRRVRPLRILMSVDMMNCLFWNANLLSSNRLKKGSDSFLFLFILIPNNLFNALIFDLILSL